MEGLSKRFNDKSQAYAKIRELTEECVKKCPYNVTLVLGLIQLTCKHFKIYKRETRTYRDDSRHGSITRIDYYAEFERLVDLAKSWLQVVLDVKRSPMSANYGLFTLDTSKGIKRKIDEDKNLRESSLSLPSHDEKSLPIINEPYIINTLLNTDISYREFNLKQRILGICETFNLRMKTKFNSI